MSDLDRYAAGFREALAGLTIEREPEVLWTAPYTLCDGTIMEREPIRGSRESAEEFDERCRAHNHESRLRHEQQLMARVRARKSSIAMPAPPPVNPPTTPLVRQVAPARRRSWLASLLARLTGRRA